MFEGPESDPRQQEGTAALLTFLHLQCIHHIYTSFKLGGSSEDSRCLRELYTNKEGKEIN